MLSKHLYSLNRTKELRVQPDTWDWSYSFELLPCWNVVDVDVDGHEACDVWILERIWGLLPLVTGITIGKVRVTQLHMKTSIFKSKHFKVFKVGEELGIWFIRVLKQEFLFTRKNTHRDIKMENFCPWGIWKIDRLLQNKNKTNLAFQHGVLTCLLCSSKYHSDY